MAKKNTHSTWYTITRMTSNSALIKPSTP